MTTSENNNQENPAMGQQGVLTDEERHSFRYFLQFVFIPDLVKGVSRGEIPHDAILQIEGWEDFMKTHVNKDFFFEWDKFECNGLRINDEYVVAVYIFPEPMDVPDAAYGAVLINTTTNAAAYYTLECSFDGEWVLGGMNDFGHQNYGTLENPTLKAFLDWVVENRVGK